MSEKLRACPFCGSNKQNIIYSGGSTWQYVECECGVNTKADLGWSGAIENWNTRPLEDALQRKLDKAIEAIERGKQLANANNDSIAWETLDYALKELEET